MVHGRGRTAQLGRNRACVFVRTAAIAAFSAAAAEVLRSFTGSDVYGGSQLIAPYAVPIEPKVPAEGLTPSWETFSEAAEEAGMSRIYGGIHFDPGNTAGQLLGRKTGARAFARARRLWLGAA